MSVIHFQPFTFNDFERLKSWISSEKELIQFAGPIFSHPLTNEQLEKYIASKDRKVCKIILDETAEIIGHCEFNFENGIHRISRVLIGDERFRNRGIGTEVIVKMSREFFNDKAVEAIDLNVFAWNDRAIKCYENIGFKINITTLFERKVDGEIWENHNMILTREDFNRLQF